MDTYPEVLMKHYFYCYIWEYINPYMWIFSRCIQQWRIQNFPGGRAGSWGGGAPTSKVGTPSYILTIFFLETAWKQENSPPWMQEACRMSHSKCSLCCSVSWQVWRGSHSVLDRGTPSSPGWQGVSHPVFDRGTPSSPGQGRVSPSKVQGGIPFPG